MLWVTNIAWAKYLATMFEIPQTIWRTERLGKKTSEKAFWTWWKISPFLLLIKAGYSALLTCYPSVAPTTSSEGSCCQDWEPWAFWVTFGAASWFSVVKIWLLQHLLNHFFLGLSLGLFWCRIFRIPPPKYGSAHHVLGIQVHLLEGNSPSCLHTLQGGF